MNHRQNHRQTPPKTAGTSGGTFSDPSATLPPNFGTCRNTNRIKASVQFTATPPTTAKSPSWRSYRHTANRLYKGGGGGGGGK